MSVESSLGCSGEIVFLMKVEEEGVMDPITTAILAVLPALASDMLPSPASRMPIKD
jgi:hypothetical protein